MSYFLQGLRQAIRYLDQGGLSQYQPRGADADKVAAQANPNPSQPAENSSPKLAMTLSKHTKPFGDYA